MLQNVLFYLFLIYVGTFVIGKFLQQFRIPWIFASLLVGLFLSFNSQISLELNSSEAFKLLSDLGLYFLLFIIGFSIDLKSIIRQKKYIFKTTAIIILGEALVGSILVHALFDLSWEVSMLVALSFATVGEVVLLPILEEFNLVHKPLGKTILNIGVLDDVFEVGTIIIVSILLGVNSGSGFVTVLEHLLLALAIILSPLLIKYFKQITNKWTYGSIDLLFLASMMVFFFFVWLGGLINAPELAALMAGIVLKNSIPDKQLDAFSSDMHTLAYGFLAPIFFVSVGLATDFSGFSNLAWMIILISSITAFVKIALTYLTTKERLGTHASIVAGIALTVRLSTSIVIIKILLDSGIIPPDLFTVLVGTTIVFKFINPVLISYLITRWKLDGSSPNTAPKLI